MNTAKYDLSELVRYIVNLGFTGGNNGLNGITLITHFLDRPGNDLGNDAFQNTGGQNDPGDLIQ